MKHRVYINLFSVLISLWAILSAINVLYNFTKSYSELKQWGGKSDYVKRKMIFGDLYDFVLFSKISTAGKDYIYFSDNDMAFYLSRYFVYPQKIYWDNNKAEINETLKSNNISYIVTLNKEISLNNFVNIAIFSTKGFKSKVYKKR